MPAKFLCSVMGAALLLALHPAGAQDAKLHRVGVILQGGPWYAVVDGLREGLNQLGLVEGKQFIFDIRDTRGDLKAVEDAARLGVHIRQCGGETSDPEHSDRLCRGNRSCDRWARGLDPGTGR
jgi:hypothetical protein